MLAMNDGNGGLKMVFFGPFYGYFYWDMKIGPVLHRRMATGYEVKSIEA
jgi:hypothetical protein